MIKMIIHNLGKITMVRKYKTKAYDVLEAFCDDDQGGDSTFMMTDKFTREEVVELLYPVIRKEVLASTTENTTK